MSKKPKKSIKLRNKNFGGIIFSSREQLRTALIAMLVVIVALVIVFVVFLKVWPRVAQKTGPAQPSVSAPADTDGDKLNDNFEKTYGLSAATDDSDGDGLKDYDEIYIYQTNPFSADTDGDGFKDKEEVDKGFNPNGEGKLNL